MRRLEGIDFEPYRVKTPPVLLAMNPGAEIGPKNGCFIFERPAGTLRVVAANGGGWDHVSVSLKDRCPTWDEMEWVKRRFFRINETAMQLHVPPVDHISNHPYVLHLWRPHDKAIPLPPKEYV